MAKRSKKMECKTLSLRGTISLTDSRTSLDNEIFTFESPDRTTAWRITKAWFWPKTVLGNTSGDHQFVTTAWLSTDTMSGVEEMDVNDNRACAWSYNGYYARGDNTDEFLVPMGSPLPEAGFIIDPNTVVTNQLFLSAVSYAEHAQAVVREYNYMVVLESMNISPTESILQQLKGIGQDVDQ